MATLYREKLLLMKGWAEDNIGDVEEFAIMFDISLEDMIECFPDALVKHYSKVFTPDVDESLEEEDEQEAWDGYRVFGEEE